MRLVAAPVVPILLQSAGREGGRAPVRAGAEASNVRRRLAPANAAALADSSPGRK